MLTSATQCSCAFPLHTSFPTRGRTFAITKAATPPDRSEGCGRKADRRVGSALDGGSPTPASPAPLPSSTWSRDRLPAVPLKSFHGPVFRLQNHTGPVFLYLAGYCCRRRLQNHPGPIVLYLARFCCRRRCHRRRGCPTVRCHRCPFRVKLFFCLES
ncbi:hypothetical protein MTO96_031165 [Rhipicephalus appendiculatus]